MGDQQTLFDPLTGRELEILALMAEGLSNHEIAHQLSLTHGTVKWYSSQIYSKLGVNNRTQAVARLGSLYPSESQHTSADSTFNLPMSLTPFIGRQREIHDIKHLLGNNRLVTITGPGGSGKTRLALQVAASIQYAFADGSAFVDLASVANPTLVASAIAHTLNISEHPDMPLSETLRRALHGQEKLLLIDNFEHVIDAALLLSDLLINAPKLAILATSREALHLNGEQEYPVPPLSLPERNSADSQTLAECEATALFLQRVQLTQPQFEITDDSAPAIAEICLRLDGLPLAIELAAARCKLLSPQELLKRLNNRLSTLSGGPRDLPTRQQTLRRTIDWSYDLLDDSEQALFARLAVFRGGRSLEAIEAVCAEGLPDKVFDALTGLLDKSLIYRKDSVGGEARFWMLETIHEYAWERLEASGEAETIRQRHAAYFVDLAERAEPELRRADQYHWGQILEAERDNFRAVLQWSLGDGDATLGVRLTGALHVFWFHHGYHSEGYKWTQQLLEHLEHVPRRYHAKFLNCVGWMAALVGSKQVVQLFNRALEVSRGVEDTAQTAWSLAYLGLSMLNNPDQAIALAEEAVTLFRELDDKPGIAGALNIIGEIARYNDDYQRARIVYEESQAVGEEACDIRRIYVAMSNLAFVAMHEGNYTRAIELDREALRFYRDINNWDVAAILHHLCMILALAGQSNRAARLFGASEQALERLGAFFDPADQPEIDRGVAAMRAYLGDNAFDIARAEGQKMTLEQAVAYALDETLDSTSLSSQGSTG